MSVSVHISPLERSHCGLISVGRIYSDYSTSSAFSGDGPGTVCSVTGSLLPVAWNPRASISTLSHSWLSVKKDSCRFHCVTKYSSFYRLSCFQLETNRMIYVCATSIRKYLVNLYWKTYLAVHLAFRQRVNNPLVQLHLTSLSSKTSFYKFRNSNEPYNIKSILITKLRIDRYSFYRRFVYMRVINKPDMRFNVEECKHLI